MSDASVDLKTVTVPEFEFMKIISERSADQVDQKMRDRELKWRSLITLVVGGLAILGYSNINSIREQTLQSVRQEIADASAGMTNSIASRFTALEESLRREALLTAEESVNQLFSERFTGMLDELRRDSMLGQLDIKLDGLENRGSYNVYDEDILIDTLSSLSMIEGIEENSKYQRVVERAVDNFFLADSPANIANMLDIAERTMLNVEGVHFTMYDFFAIEFLRSATISRETQDAFQEFVRRSEHMELRPVTEAGKRYAELVLDFRLAGNRRTDVGDALAAEVLGYDKDVLRIIYPAFS